MIWKYLNDTTSNLLYGIGAIKLLAIGQISALTSLPIAITENITGWYLENWVFLSFVSFALMIDHLIGSYMHWLIKDDWSWKKNIHGILNKSFSVIAVYVLLEMMHQIVQDVDFIAIYFKITLQLIVFLYPTSSAMANISILTKGKFPPSGWMDKIKKFNEDVKLNHFKTENNETDEMDEVYSDYDIDNPDDIGVSQSEEEYDVNPRKNRRSPKGKH